MQLASLFFTEANVRMHITTPNPSELPAGKDVDAAYRRWWLRPPFPPPSRADTERTKRTFIQGPRVCNMGQASLCARTIHMEISSWFHFWGSGHFLFSPSYKKPSPSILHITKVTYMNHSAKMNMHKHIQNILPEGFLS